MNTMHDGFEIKLPQFEGPFDLLLFFIERDELDIHDIPIAAITNDFLDYIHQMQAFNIEVASEFILVAATLMRIKAKMLLPRPELDEEGNEVDPREDLVQKLIEYKKYKNVLPELQKLEADRMDQERRGNIVQELSGLASQAQPGEELESLDLYKLLKVYERVLKRYQAQSEEVIHTVLQYPYTIEEQKTIISTVLARKSRMSFEDVLLLSKDKVHLIYNFLAVLEMVQQRLIILSTGLGFNNFWIEPIEAES